MTPELIGLMGVGVAVLGVGATLAALLVAALQRIDRLGDRVSAVEQRLSRLEGLLEGILYRRSPEPPGEEVAALAESESSDPVPAR